MTAWASPATGDEEIEGLEMRLLLEAIYLRYGYDFRDYSPSILKLRIWDRIRAERLSTISGFQERILHDDAALERFVHSLSLRSSGMFQDRELYETLRSIVIPYVRDQYFIRIWQIGCSSGEQVYSLAIVLEEEGVYEKARIYVTDIDDTILKRARQGIYPMREMRKAAAAYLAAGGKHTLADYYNERFDDAVMKPELRKNIILAQHSLATDSSFNEFNVIICRDILMYFNPSLQERAHMVMYDSLSQGGFLVLGPRDNMDVSEYSALYEKLAVGNNVFQKVR